MISPIARLIAGVRAFRAVYYEQRPERIQTIVENGQKPQVLVIACSDSRVDPAILMNVEPGELFVVRNVANLVPPYEPDNNYHGTSAALEFAIRDLQVSHVIVLGHSKCGGIQALMKNSDGEPVKREFIGPWMNIVDRACSHCRTEDGKLTDGTAVEQTAIRISLDNLATFPWIRERLDSGKLKLHGWWFELETGMLWGLDRYAEEFKPLL